MGKRSRGPGHDAGRQLSQSGRGGAHAARAVAAVLVRQRPHASYLESLSAELDGNEIGQSSVLDRLLDIVLVSTIREWAHDLPAEHRSWVHAPVITWWPRRSRSSIDGRTCRGVWSPWPMRPVCPPPPSVAGSRP
ncbi:cupin domain-containing protein [Naumannella halotolerans]|uniref:cupin domain-containing protein n=1 Tax=Naumannella halotolerans TaxID=993414 RepID=UPI003C7C1356